MFALRGRKLIVLVASVVLAVAAIVVFTASAAAWHSAAPRSHRAVTTTSRSNAARAVSPNAPSTKAAVPANAASLAAAVTTLPKLTPAQLAGQRVIYSYTGLRPPARLLTLIRHGEVAGVIFFSDNVRSRAQIGAVARELQQAAASRLNPVHLPLLLMTDQEGGIVRRLPGAPVLSAKQVGESAHPQNAATAAGRGAGQNLHGVGLNVNLAPVLDVFRRPGNFIDQFGRSFSNMPGKVAKLGTLFATAEQAQKVAATVKHFPGLGAAATRQNTDERPVTLPISLSAIRHIDEVPYKSAIAAKVKLVMVSWAIYPALDRKFPGGLSSTIVQGELRKRLGFTGVTVTDAMEAGALRPFGSIAHRSTLAARAGMDLLLDAEGNTAEGVSSVNSLAFDLTHHTLNVTAFKSAVKRVLALRASLPG